MIKINNLRTEYQVNPVGISGASPRFNWKLDSDEHNVWQKTYRIQCALSEKELAAGENLHWDSGIVTSDQSVHVSYNGKELTSAQRIFWQVEITTNKSEETLRSEVAFFEMGLLYESDWKAKWIEADLNEDLTTSNPCPHFRTEFQVEKEIATARCYVTSHGLYQLQLNGQKVGDLELAPGWTSYHHRIQYQVYDITNYLNQGANAIGAILGDGWYRGFFGWQGKKNLYGTKTALLCQLHITYIDGTSSIITSDKNWKASTGAILESEIYHGEVYDAALVKSGWSQPDFNDSVWEPVIEKDYGYQTLVANSGSPIRVMQEIKPIEKIFTPKGELVFDFGQNLVGKIKFTLPGKKGAKITIKHAEVLDKEGNFYTTNLRPAKQRIEYTFAGDSIETYTPHFTFMGFRFIKIEAYPFQLDLEHFSALVMHSDMEFTGDFECSEPLINRLQKNIQWGLRGNFLDVPTDCPQRDERMGWTGDAQVFAPTACFNVNAAPFFSKWLKDLEADQREDGNVPWVVPMVIEDGGGTGWSDGYGGTGWADAATFIPWTLYEKFGDLRVLEQQYNSMKAWEEFMIRESGDTYLYNTGFHFGDWLSFAEYSSYIYNAPDYGFAGAHTEKDLIATAYFYQSTKIMVETARLLGYKEDAEKYASLLPKIKTAFASEFITPNGRLLSNTQAAYAITLSFGILPDDIVPIAAKKLAENVEHFQHLTTGFLGTPVLCDALSDNGYPELAFKLLFNTKYPSWLYAVTMGATTIWERWDGIKPDGTFQNEGMNSFNHYAYGAIGNWLYSKVAGIQCKPENPGYKEIIIKPLLTKKLNFVSCSLDSLYGKIASKWEVQNRKLTTSVTIPPNTKAVIYIPTSANGDVLENSVSIKNSKTVVFKHFEKDYCVVEAGSGHYVFTSNID